MAANKNLQKLKEQLAKQKEKEREKPLAEIIVMKKEKVKPLAFVPSQKVMQKKASEEIFMREMLTLVKKKEKSLSSIKISGDDIPYGRAPFISNLQQLDRKNLKKFIKEYLDQNKGYTDFYRKWILENKERLEALEEEKGGDLEEKKSSPKGEINTKTFFDNRDTIYAQMLDRARAYAADSNFKLSGEYVIEVRVPGLPLQYVVQENQSYKVGQLSENRLVWGSISEAEAWLEEHKGIEGKIVPKESYYEIISNDDSLHQDLAEDYIELARVLEIEEPEELKLATLISKIIEKEQLLASLVDEKLFIKIDGMSHKQLKKEAKKQGIDPNLNPKLLKIELLKIAKGKTIEDFKAKKESKEQIRAQIKKEKSEALLRSEILIKLNTLTGAKRIYRKMDVEELTKEYDKQLLINKLSIITGQDKDTFSSWSLEHLQEHYKTIEQGEEYLDNIQRYNMIEFLVESGRSRDSLEKLSNKKLRKLVNKYNSQQKDKKRIRVKESSTFSWIPYPVTGVWVKPVETMIVDGQEFLDNESIKGYFLPDEKINVKAGDKMQIYYKASPKFFKNKNRFNQSFRDKVFILESKLNKRDPKYWIKKFSVGYTIKDQNVGYPVVDDPSLRLIPLTRRMYLKEMKHYEKVEEKTKKSLKEFEKSPIDNTIIQVGKEILSSELQKVAPQASSSKPSDEPFIMSKDRPEPVKGYIYDVNGQFVNNFITSITGDCSNIKCFFTSLGEFIVYLKISAAKVLKKRLQEEYYLPDILAHLSPQEKFPEIFSSTFSQEEMADYAKEINRRVTAFKNKICKQLYQIKINPTAKAKTQDVLDVFEDDEDFDLESDYKIGICENKDEEIPKDRIVFYKDTDKKVYCFDIEELCKNFTLGNYKNPHTGNKFSKDFIKRCTVSYEGISYPLRKLKKELSDKDTYRGVTFSPQFLKLIRSGKYKNLLELNFKRFNKQLELCQNSNDVKDESPENIVFYEDEGRKYCFPIRKIFEMIEYNPDVIPINIYTGRPFSEAFLDRFKRTFRPPLEVREKVVQKDKLVIPDLWNIVLQELYKIPEGAREVRDEDLEGMFDDEPDEKKKDKESVAGFTFNSAVQEEVPVQKEMESSSSIESEFSDSDQDSDQDSGSESNSGSESASESNSGSESASESNEEKSEPEEGAKKLSHPTICSYCKKKEGIFKSIGYNKEPITYYFCCAKCMEDFEFVPFKK